MPKVSIIIPVYNVEKYIDECFQSIIAQDMSDWEAVVVDDGSTDSSGMICDRYKEQDSRFRVFHTDNNGVGNARNFGLHNSRGGIASF